TPTQAWPGYCTCGFAETRARSPGERRAVDLGYPAAVGTVTAVAARGIHTVVEATQESGEGVLQTLVSSMTAGGISGYAFQARGASPVVVLGPEHAAEIAAAGFSRKDVKAYLVQHVRLPLGQIKGRGHWGTRSWPEAWEKERDDFMVPLVLSPDRFVLVVA